MNRFLVLILTIFSFSVFANESKVEINPKLNKSKLNQNGSFGHNMSPNSYTLNKGDFAVGPYATVYGVTDNFMVGMSPWIYYDYNANNFTMKYKIDLGNEQAVSFQYMYFKTYGEFDDAPIKDYTSGKTRGFEYDFQYIMEVSKYYATYSNKITDSVTSHTTLTYDYYNNETYPYSIRREPLNNDPYQFNLSNLFEIQLQDNLLLQQEIGVLGLNYFYPQIIYGASLGFQFDDLYLQLGFSMTGTYEAYMNPDKRRNVYFDIIGGEYNRDSVKYDFSMHPELQLQYFF